MTIHVRDSGAWSDPATSVDANLSATVQSLLAADDAAAARASIGAVSWSDTTPSLGGNLTVNSHNVGDASAADLTALHGRSTVGTTVLQAADAAAVRSAISGAGIRSVQTVTNAVVLGADAGIDYVAFLSTSGTVTLPTAVGNVRRYTIKNIDTVNHTVATTSSQTIDGFASNTFQLIPGMSIDVISDGANWRII